jgi:hypothetical protein
MDDILYVNTGDWVESNTAVVEHHDGQLELIHWTDAAQAILGEKPKEGEIAIAA